MYQPGILCGFLAAASVAACSTSSPSPARPPAEPAASKPAAAPAAAPAETSAPALTQVANPASQHCIASGGRVAIRDQPDGSQIGYCVFPDGSECEEWAFFRGQCKPAKPAPQR